MRFCSFVFVFTSNGTDLFCKTTGHLYYLLCDFCLGFYFWHYGHYFKAFALYGSEWQVCDTHSAQMQALSKERLPRLEGTMIRFSYPQPRVLYSHCWGWEADWSVHFPWSRCDLEWGGVGWDLSSGMTACHWQNKRVTFNLCTSQLVTLQARQQPLSCPLWQQSSCLLPLQAFEEQSHLSSPSCPGMVLGTWMVSGAHLLKAFRHICRWSLLILQTRLPWWLSDKESAWYAGDHLQCKRHGFNPWVRKIPWRRTWQPTPVFLPGNPMDRGAWHTAVHGIVEWHDLATKPPTSGKPESFQIFFPLGSWVNTPSPNSSPGLDFVLEMTVSSGSWVPSNLL